jgi:hypothetical protein
VFAAGGAPGNVADANPDRDHRGGPTVRRRLALISTIAACVAAPAIAWAGGPDNIVKVTVPDDGQAVQRAGVRVSQTSSDTVDSTNLAQAYAHDCTGCEAVAVAFQAVVATGRPHTITPQNLAIALNQNCSHCRSFAYAYQYFVQADKPVRFTRDERAEFRQVNERADELVHAGLPYPELDARLHQLAQEFRADVDRALVDEDVHGDGQAREQQRQREGD